MRVAKGVEASGGRRGDGVTVRCLHAEGPGVCACCSLDEKDHNFNSI